MKNIGKWIYSTLKGDSTLLTAIGGSATNPRIYYFHPPENISYSSTNASISFFLVGSGGLGGDPVYALEKPSEIYQISIFSKSKATTETAFERIDVLLNRIHDASITSWKTRHIHRVGQVDLYEPDDHIIHKALDYAFDGIWDNT